MNYNTYPSYINTYDVHILYIMLQKYLQQRLLCSAGLFFDGQHTQYLYVLHPMSPEVFMTVIVNVGHTRRLNRNIIFVTLYLFFNKK